MEAAVEAPKKSGWLRAVLIGRNPKRTLVRLVVVAIACYVVFKFMFLPAFVDGGSMMPTYQKNGLNFVNRLAYLWSSPQRGDVVAVRTSGTSIMYMKRIVGLPGETVQFHHGRLLIDGKILDEPYVKYPCHWEIPLEKVPPGWYYVVGDNRSMPEKDHRKGAVPRNRIVGKILLCKNLFASSSSPPP